MTKTIVTSVILAVAGYLLVYFVGFGIADNGALGIALGLLIGVLVGARDTLTKVDSPSAARPARAPQTRAPQAQTQTRGAASDSGTLSIFVGNLAYKTRGRQLASIFEPYGEIISIRIVKDRETGKAKGFGFVEMHEADAMRAIADLDGSDFFGRSLKVSAANSQKGDVDI